VPPPSLLVLYEGRLHYQRSLVRTWAPCYAVLTSDRFIHAFSPHASPDAPDGAQHSSRVRSAQLLFSVRCARGCEPTDVTSSAAAAALLGGSKPEEKLGYFAVPTRVDGLLGKVGLSSGKVSSITFRATGQNVLSGWMEALRSASQCQ